MTSLQDFNYRHFFMVRRNFVWAIVVGVFAAVIVLFAILPMIQGISKSRNALDKKKQAVEKLQNKVLALEQVETLRIVENSGLINSALSSKKPLLELLAVMNRVATSSKVVIESVELNPGKISTEDGENAIPSRISGTNNKALGYDSMDVSLVISGDLDKINAFITGMETAIPVTDVLSITLNERQQKDVKTNEVVTDFEAEIVTATYYFTKTVAATIETPLVETTGDEFAFLEELKTYFFPIVSTSSQIQGGNIDLFGLDESEIEAFINQQDQQMPDTVESSVDQGTNFQEGNDSIQEQGEQEFGFPLEESEQQPQNNQDIGVSELHDAGGSQFEPADQLNLDQPKQF